MVTSLLLRLPPPSPRPEGARGLPLPWCRDIGAIEVHMPSAYTQNFYHIVFSTRHRAELISPELETRLYPFVGGIVRDLCCTLLAINGMPDHVHLLVRYRADLSHSELLQQIKGRSSKWINESVSQRM